MNDNEQNFQTWCENNGVIHLGDYLYLYKDGEYTLNQLRSIYQLEKSILDDELDAEDDEAAQIMKNYKEYIDYCPQHKSTELYFPAGFFED